MKYYIIPIFIPHFGCEHQCVFCNQKKITGVVTPVTPNEVAGIIQKHLALITQKRHVEVAFYGGSFTALPIQLQRSLLFSAHQALQRGDIHAIRVSTRPDCINPEILENLIDMGVSIIELGAQSLDDHVLQAGFRGHTSEDIKQSVAMIHSYSLQCGLQLMIGLPEEDSKSLFFSTRQAMRLHPDFVRIYPTLVIADTPLARLFQSGAYRPLTLSEAVAKAAFMKLSFTRQGTPVIRIGLQATEDLANESIVLSGPYHPAFGELVDAHIFDIMVNGYFDQIQDYGGKVIIHHHLKDGSKLRGVGNANLKRWIRAYRQLSIQLVADAVQPGQVIFEFDKIRYVINPAMLSQC